MAGFPVWYSLRTAKFVTDGDIHCVHTALCVYIFSRQFETEIGLVHQFQFSSTLQRMSVVTRTLGSQDFVLYCKGSPEMLVSLSRPETGEAIIQWWENLVHEVTSKHAGHTRKIHGHSKQIKVAGHIKTWGSLENTFLNLNTFHLQCINQVQKYVSI
jgi:magnesium-transporting ATPase (P-type)